jgi:hypothetical protein
MKPLVMIKIKILFTLIAFFAVQNLYSKVLHPKVLFPCDSPEVSGNFSTYLPKKHMLSFPKYVERPIPVKVWKDTSAYFYFSDTAEKDRFRFSVVGDYEYTATVFFQIISTKGICIFKDSFPLMNLLEMYLDGGGYYGTKTQKERAISEYAKTILDPNSVDAALEMLPEELDPDFTIHENHHYLATDGAQKFFSYSRKVETNTFIGYDPLLGLALKFYESYY